MRTLHSSGRIMVPRTMNLWSKKFKEVNFITWMYMIYLYTHIHTTISDFHVSIIRWRTSCLSWKSQLNFCSIFSDHGHFDASGFSICDSKEMRLRRIRNLGMSSFVYFWACSTTQVHNFLSSPFFWWKNLKN